MKKKDIFDLKKGQHELFDKPKKFYCLYGNGSNVSFQQRITYGVWHSTRKIDGKRVNVFYFQYKENKLTRQFDWWLRVTDVAMTIKDALILAKAKRIETAKEGLAVGERKVKLNQTYLNNYSNFEPSLEQDEYDKRYSRITFTFPKLKDIRQSTL